VTIIHFEVTNCDTNGTENFTKDFIKDFTKDFTKENNIEISERQYDILLLLTKDHTLTSQKISQKISQKKPVSMRTILKDLAELQQKGFLRREGGRKNGYWQLLFLPLD
jgi:predicted HTH transcriptional regulator